MPPHSLGKVGTKVPMTVTTVESYFTGSRD